MRVWGATSQLDLPSLTPFFVAGCGRLQLGVPQWVTSVDYSKWLTIDPTFCGRFSTGRLLDIEHFTSFFPSPMQVPSAMYLPSVVSSQAIVRDCERDLLLVVRGDVYTADTLTLGY